MCGGFTCSKNTLVGLNVIYILVSFLLIGVAVHGRVSGVITSLPIIGGITFCGVVLLIISIIGLIGAMRHHQVVLFCYMVVLFFIFLIQFSVSVAALSMTDEDEQKLLNTAWGVADNETKLTAEKTFGCCGLNNSTDGYKCEEVTGCVKTSPAGNSTGPEQYSCPTCMDKIKDKIDSAFNAAGGVGLFFSFTELFGGIVAFRYRNLMDPFATGPAGAPFSNPK